MKLTNQTKYSLFYSDGTRLTYGNCLIACVASLLDEPIDEVPNVYTFYGLDEKDKTTEDHAWFKVMNLWLDLKHQKCIKKHSLDDVTKEEYVIMRGASQRGKPHCCIFKNENGTFLPHFDPHPTLQYLQQNHYYYTIESKYNIYI